MVGFGGGGNLILDTTVFLECEFSTSGCVLLVLVTDFLLLLLQTRPAITQAVGADVPGMLVGLRTGHHGVHRMGLPG